MVSFIPSFPFLVCIFCLVFFLVDSIFLLFSEIAQTIFLQFCQYFDTVFTVRAEND